MWGGVTVNSPTLSTGVQAGRFAISGFVVGSPTTLFNQSTYCVDLFTTLFTSVNYNISPLSAVVSNAGRQSLVAGLLVNSASLFNAATNDTQRSLIAAATQLSVWELVYETIGSPLTVSTGNFSVFGDFSPTVSTLANSYLASNWTASPNLVASLVSVNGQSQNQVYLAAAAVAEPKTWLSMITGFGIVGGSLRRRRRAKTALA